MQKPIDMPGRPVFSWRYAALALFLIGAPPAWGQTTVTLTNASFFSLQAAVASGGTVVLAFNGTITAAGPLLVLQDTVVDASGFQVTLDGSNSTSLFYVGPGVHFQVTNLTMANGQSLGGNGAGGPNNPGNGFVGYSGANGSNGMGGAIYNTGMSEFVNCTFLTNNATGGNGGDGGGPPPGGSQAGNGGGGGIGYGGAIYNLSALILSNCTFAGNSVIGGNGGLSTNGVGTNGIPRAGMGGAGAISVGAALYNAPGASAVILDCTFNNNLAQGGGSQPGGGSIQGNNGTPGAPGGNAEAGAIGNWGTNTMINSTFYANAAMGGTGGNGGAAPPGGFAGGAGGAGGDGFGGSVLNAGWMSVTNCTFAGAVALGGAGGSGAGGPHGVGANGPAGLGFGANIANNDGIFDLKNSILASSTTASNAFGTITDQGNNISSDGSPVFSAPYSQNNLDAGLLDLNNNGGPTETMALVPGSPAIDAIYDASAPLFDQRGVPRPLGDRSDIGAFEFGSTYSVSGQIAFGSNVFAGATLSITDGVRSYGTVTDTNGNYSLNFLPTGSYTLTPQPAGFFTPPSVQVSLPSTLTGVNFAAAPATAAITMTPDPDSQSFVVNIAFSGIPNLPYRIQECKDFSPWKNAVTNNSGPSGVFYFSQNTTNFTKRFFQAIP